MSNGIPRNSPRRTSIAYFSSAWQRPGSLTVNRSATGVPTVDCRADERIEGLEGVWRDVLGRDDALELVLAECDYLHDPQGIDEPRFEQRHVVVKEVARNTELIRQEGAKPVAHLGLRRHVALVIRVSAGGAKNAASSVLAAARTVSRTRSTQRASAPVAGRPKNGLSVPKTT